MQALKLMKQWRKEKGEEGEAMKEAVGGGGGNRGMSRGRRVS